MKTKKASFLIVLILIVFTGCQTNPTQKKKPGQSGTISSGIPSQKSASGPNCDTTIINQEFGYGALAFEVFKADTNKIKSLFLDPVILKIEKQTNDQGAVYDLYNFTDGMNKISLYRNDSGFYMEDADIKNNRVLLNKKLSIGMAKNIFRLLLKVKTFKCDTINVTDEESTFETTYIFKDARLQKIKMGQILE